ncbi:spermidine hydroxycinnamoyl transferase [Trifolium repens]|nr:spermidine hydroxycinnamoyl transferase [Trifolium repens]
MAPPWVQELHLNPLTIPVTIVNTFSVTPSKPIPVKPGDSLYLSNLDDMIGARVFTPTVYFYQSDNSSTCFQKPVLEILRLALADVLVPYYPFSGRLRETKTGKLEVFFGEKEEQGALMVEARSNIALSELGDFAAPNPN